ncbi:MAG: hypothetical protein ACOCV2_15025 [Persicimonas sp.]
MSETVAIAPNGSVYHELDADGSLRCNLDRKDAHEFDRVPLSLVADELTRCQHCSGEAAYSGGQGSTLAAKLAAADPDEVSVR